VLCRPANANEADAIAHVSSTSLRSLSFVPILHTEEEDRAFIRETLQSCSVTVVEDDGVIIGVLARCDEEIRLLHVLPSHRRRGVGTLLINKAKEEAEKLELWCFQQNIAARQFYESHDFEPVLFTKGQNNEEKLPDVRYRWSRDALQAGK
jgi:GNAT superfamily N-acetyltransferase